MESQKVKRLYRSETDKVVAGVCAGIAQYINVDPVVIRVVWLASVLLAGTGLLLYVVCWIVIPTESVVKQTMSQQSQDEQSSQQGTDSHG